MKAQSAYGRIVAGTRLDTQGGRQTAEAGNYEDDDCRFGRVMRMLREGANYTEVVYRYPEFDSVAQLDMLRVMQKVIDGTISRGSDSFNASTSTGTADSRRAAVITMMLNGYGEDEIARLTGMEPRTVYYYIYGRAPHEGRRKRRE